MIRRQITKPIYSIIWQMHAPACNVFSRRGIVNEITGTAQYVCADGYSQYGDILTIKANKNIFMIISSFSNLFLCMMRVSDHTYLTCCVLCVVTRWHYVFPAVTS